MWSMWELAYMPGSFHLQDGTGRLAELATDVQLGHCGEDVALVHPHAGLDELVGTVDGLDRVLHTLTTDAARRQPPVVP